MSIDAIPLWAFFAGVVAIVMVSLEGGYRLGNLAHKRSQDEKESPVSVIAGSILGLGAFILAFTFGIVSNRFDARRELVRNEANAIRTAWLRSDFLSEPDRAATKELFRQYLEARLAFAQSPETVAERAESFLTGARRAQARLWEVAVANARKDMNSDVGALYVEALNEMFSIHALRVAVGLQMRIPTGIWLMLLALTSLGMVGLGYQTGIAGSRRSLAQPILAVSFALVITLIGDLDRPAAGIASVTQQPLIDLQSWMSEGRGGNGRNGEASVRLPAESRSHRHRARAGHKTRSIRQISQNAGRVQPKPLERAFEFAEIG
jgi:hypothetical protein